MKTLTTEDIAAVKAAHATLARVVAKLEASTVEPAFFVYQCKRIPLATGETYVGTIITRHAGYHLILLPGQVAGKNWKDAMMWAESIGGELPSLFESALLFAMLKNQFDATWYWTGEESGSGFSWVQYFGNGFQISYQKSNNHCTRAVRRLDIGD